MIDGRLSNDENNLPILLWKESISGSLESNKVAETIYFVFNQSQSVNIREVVLAPTKQQA